MKTRTVPLPIPHRILAKRKKGYAEALHSLGTKSADGKILTISEENFAAIRVKFSLRKCPPIGRRIINGAKAVGRYGAAKLQSHETSVTETQYQERMTICQTCDQYKKGDKPENDQCAQCGCYLRGKLFHKAKLTTETCPLNKWPELTPAN